MPTMRSNAAQGLLVTYNMNRAPIIAWRSKQGGIMFLFLLSLQRS